VAEILLIEDMAGVRRAIGSMLKRAGHNVTPAESGGEGVRQLKERRFDLVVTDMLMPDIDGTEILYHVCEMPERPPVIAISGGGAGVSAEAALRAARYKADAFLQKPFDGADLIAAIDKLLSKSA